MAETKGFEPLIQLPVYTISSRAHSTSSATSPNATNYTYIKLKINYLIRILFLLPLDQVFGIIWGMKPFYEQVYDIVAKIPPGTVTTYGDIAKMLGRPRAARFVGYAMNASVETDNNLPWHRVTFADGRTWDGQWEAVQRDLLTAEGVGFTKDGHIDVEKYRWRPESLTAPIDMRDMPLKF